MLKDGIDLRVKIMTAAVDNRPERIHKMKEKNLLKDLVPTETLSSMLDSFTGLAGVAGVVMDLNGDPVCRPSRHTRYCRDFIHATEDGRKSCRAFAKRLCLRAIERGDMAWGMCPFFLYECRIPIRVKDKAVGILGLGQVLVEDPDMEKHRKTGTRLGLDPDDLMEALAEVPRMSAGDFNQKTRTFGLLASLVAEQGAAGLEAKKAAEKQSELAGLLYHHLPIGVTRLTTGLEVIMINRFVEERFGISSGEAVGKKCYLVVGQYRDDPSRTEKEKICDDCQALAALESGSPRSMVRRIRKDFIVETTAVPVCTPDGRTTEIMEIVRDVTEEVTRREEITRSRDHLNTILNSMFDSLLVVDRDLRIVDANDRFLFVHKKGRDEILGRHCYEITLRLDRPCYEAGRPCPAKEALETGRPAMAEVSHMDPDGKTIFAEIAAAPLFDKKGRVYRVLEVIRDITDRRLAEERYRTIFNEARDGIVIIDAETGRIQDCNPEFEKMAGRSLRELRKMKAWEIRPPDKMEKARKKFEEIRQKDAGGSGELEIIKPDDTIVPVEFTAKRICFEDKEFYLSLVRDVTERKRAEAERRKLEEELSHARKMEAIGQLTSGIAHDFNNLLTSIMGNAELAMMDLDGNIPLSRHIAEIIKAGEKAASLTRQLLGFSRKQMVRVEPLDLNKVIQDVEKMLRRLIREDIKMSTILEPRLWRVRADADQMLQVIMNLVVNARDAMPQGGSLIIETANKELDGFYFLNHGVKEETGRYVMLAVTDTGVGMDKKTISRIFEPFFTTKERGTGTGMGLATVYGIVKQANGFIWPYSEPGKGTTLKVYLPARA